MLNLGLLRHLGRLGQRGEHVLERHKSTIYVVPPWRCLVTTTIQSTDLRRQVREVLDRVRREQEPVIVRT